MILLIISRKYPNLFDLMVKHGGSTYYDNLKMKLIFKFPPGRNIGGTEPINDVLGIWNYTGGNVTTSSIVGVQDETKNAEETTEEEGEISPSPTKDD